MRKDALLVGAVVVGERDDVGRHMRRDPRCERVRARARSEDGERSSPVASTTASSRSSAVLVDEDQPEALCVWNSSAVEEVLELLRPVRPSRRRGRTTEAPVARAVGYGTSVPAAPLVSVLVAVSNGERYLRAALESVLRQTVTDVELLVVDDGSTDATPAILGGVDRRSAAGAPKRRATRARRLAQPRPRRGARASCRPARRGRRCLSLIGSSGSSRWSHRTPEVGVRRSAECSSSTPAVGRNALTCLERGAAAMRWASALQLPVLPSERPRRSRRARASTGCATTPSYRESEDYELWTRLLAHAEATTRSRLRWSCIGVHPEQASRRRRRSPADASRTTSSLREIAASRPWPRGACRARLAGRRSRSMFAPTPMSRTPTSAFVELVRRSSSGSTAVARSPVAEPCREAAGPCACAGRAPGRRIRAPQRCCAKRLRLDPARCPLRVALAGLGGQQRRGRRAREAERLA